MRKAHRILAALAAIAMLAPVGCQFETPEAFVTSTMMRQKGYQNINEGNWVLAREDFAKAVELSPNDAVSQYYLGLTELKLGNPLAAQLALEKAYTVAPDDPSLTPRIIDRLAEAYYAQDRQDVLMGFLNQTAEERGTTRDYLRQANYQFKTGDIDSAELSYRKAAYFAEADDSTPYIAIADFYQTLGDRENAVLALKYGYYVSPGDPRVTSRMRKLGLVPGPTHQEEPPKPAMLKTPWQSPVNLDVLISDVEERVR